MLKTETRDSKVRLTGISNNMIEKITQFAEDLVKEYCNIFLGTAELNTILSLPQIFGLDHVAEAFSFTFLGGSFLLISNGIYWRKNKINEAKILIFLTQKNPHLIFYCPVSLIFLQYALSALSSLALYFSSSFRISKY